MCRWGICSLVTLAVLTFACSRGATTKRRLPVLVLVSVPITVRLQYNVEAHTQEIVVTVGDSSFVRILAGQEVRWNPTTAWTQVRGIGLDGREFVQLETRVVPDSSKLNLWATTR